MSGAESKSTSDHDVASAMPPALDLWLGLVERIDHLHREVLAHVEEATGVAPTWFPVVMHLASVPEPRLPMHTLSNARSMTTGGFTKLADRIEAAGLIDRVPSHSDRRIIYAELTAAGRAAAAQSNEIVTAWIERFVLTEIAASDLIDARSRLLRVTSPSEPTNASSGSSPPAGPAVHGPARAARCASTAPVRVDRPRLPSRSAAEAADQLAIDAAVPALAPPAVASSARRVSRR